MALSRNYCSIILKDWNVLNLEQIEIVADVYEQFPQSRNYIEMCCEMLTQGRIGAGRCRHWLETNVIQKYHRAHNLGSELDKEFKEKMNYEI